MRRIDRNALQAPARVLDVELATVADLGEETLLGEETIAVEQLNGLWCLARIDGVPQEISFWDVTEDVKISIGGLRDQLRAGLAADGHVTLELPAPPTADPGPDLTVVICTRDRAAGLQATLASLHEQRDANFRVVVVENGSRTAESAAAVEKVGLPHCDYVVEPRPGLSRARNRGLAAVGTELVAWIDDDETTDADWVSRLRQGFAHEASPAAICGVMLPAELESEAQVRFEQYGGFNKGRGMAPEVLRKGTSSVVSPLYPLPAFGSGGNMAFKTEALRAVGGFDNCLGAGTRTHGGEEVRVLSLLLSRGDAILHWPAAITWHTHRRDMPALKKQFYGYSAGLSAFYASMIRSKPTAALEILGLTPHVIRDLRHGSDNQRSGHLPDDFPPDLLKAARRGLIEGGFMYAYEALKDWRRPMPASGEDT
jgi:glycosyltransferase involved in cell wall biosynthesis